MKRHACCTGDCQQGRRCVALEQRKGVSLLWLLFSFLRKDRRKNERRSGWDRRHRVAGLNDKQGEHDGK